MTSLIRNLNPNMASDFDGMSGQKLLLCDNLVVFPLKKYLPKYFENFYIPGMWKLANVTNILITK